MGVRLAFAVQAHIDPDVLVVDEALAVGDELFQKKCYDHLSRLKERGTAVLLVTHSCPQIIQHCDQALLLHKGRARMLAQAARVTVTYQRLINASDAEWDENFPKANQSLQTDSNAASYQETTQFCSHETAVQQELSAQHEPWLDTSLIPQTTDIYPSKGVRIDDVWIETTSGIRVNTLPFGQEFIVIFSYKATDDLEKIGMACHLASHTGLRISGQSVPEAIGAHQGGHIAQIPAETSWQVRYAFHGGLWPGIYFIGGGVVSCAGGGANFLHRVVDFRALRILDSRPISVIGASSLQASQPQIHGLVTDAQLKRPVPRPAPAET
jgi:lipopolysaccharide transport system ATP-binding protein